MLPRLARPDAVCVRRDDDFTDTSTTAARFDDALFSGPMILIDRTNQGCGLVATAAQAEEAVAGGRAATWAGRPRPGVVAIDVDLEHKGLAHQIANDIARWSLSRGLWVAVRPSGGGPGRLHIVVAAGRSEELVRALVEDWRDDARLTTRQLDLRSAIRPFSAPHRRTGRQHVPETLDEKDLADVRSVVHGCPPRQQRQHPAVQATIHQLPHHPSHLRLLSPPLSGDTTRSGVEFAQTLALYNSGASASAAWECVSGQSDSKSSERGRRWWEVNIWDKIRPRPSSGSHNGRSFDMARMILPTIAANRHRYANLHPRSRNALETVLLALLEKLQAGPTQRWTPASERDLHLCTGLDRRTIRSATATLVSLGIVDRQGAARVSDSHTYRAGPSSVRSLTAPPILTPPPSRWLPHCPPNAAHQFSLHHLDPQLSPPLSTRQQQLHRSTVQALRERGVLGHSQSSATLAADQRRWLLRLQRITFERDVFHSACRAAHRVFEQGRAERDERRRRKWWASLNQEERLDRTARWQASFRELGYIERQTRCDELSKRRQLARAAAQAPLPMAA